MRWIVGAILLGISLISPGYSQSASLTERQEDPEENRIWRHDENGVRSLTIQKKTGEGERKTLIVYATPNGNSLEETLGCQLSVGLDWHYDIQQIAAQFHWLRTLEPDRGYVLSVVESPQRSWPDFRRSASGAPLWIRRYVEELRSDVDADEIVLAGHSGGGSFLWSWIDAYESIPSHLGRLVFLDANYSFSDESNHGTKIEKWLTEDPSHRLVVLAYDDREIAMNGKRVVGPEGGTFRATERMQKSLSQNRPWQVSDRTPWVVYDALDRQLRFYVHKNPENKILHTAMIGEMNGFAFSMLDDPSKHKVELREPRGYLDWVPDRPYRDPRLHSAKRSTQHPPRSLQLPPRRDSMESGSAFCARVANLDRKEREEEVLKAILEGNIPESSRTLVAIESPFRDADEQTHIVRYYANADYLAIGSDDDSVRMPMTPSTAVSIARSSRCELSTAKISDDLFSAADLRLDPHPLTSDREHVSTFLKHHRAIEEKLASQRPEPLIVGIKKDLVVTNRLLERTHRVAIYGWHDQQGRPIQPLYVGHVDWYVDYSHGIRLIEDHVEIDGQKRSVRDVLLDPRFCRALSREGVIDVQHILSESKWLE